MYNRFMADFLPQFPEPCSEDELNGMNPAVLSFVGDSVQTLFVRAELASLYKQKTSALHRMAAQIINATSQAQAVKNILDIMTEQELSVFRRCRNCKTNTAAKNATITDYKIASGFEGVIGYLYLSGKHERLLELLNLAYNKQTQGFPN